MSRLEEMINNIKSVEQVSELCGLGLEILAKGDAEGPCVQSLVTHLVFLRGIVSKHRHAEWFSDLLSQYVESTIQRLESGIKHRKQKAVSSHLVHSLYMAYRAEHPQARPKDPDVIKHLAEKLSLRAPTIYYHIHRLQLQGKLEGLTPIPHAELCREFLSHLLEMDANATLSAIAEKSGWPKKRVETYLKRLELDGFVTHCCILKGKPNLWYLTQQGMEFLLRG